MIRDYVISLIQTGFCVGLVMLFTSLPFIDIDADFTQVFLVVILCQVISNETKLNSIKRGE